MNNNMQKGSTHSVEGHGKKGAFFFIILVFQEDQINKVDAYKICKYKGMHEYFVLLHSIFGLD